MKQRIKKTSSLFVVCIMWGGERRGKPLLLLFLFFIFIFCALCSLYFEHPAIVGSFHSRINKPFCCWAFEHFFFNHLLYHSLHVTSICEGRTKWRSLNPFLPSLYMDYQYYYYYYYYYCPTWPWILSPLST